MYGKSGFAKKFKIQNFVNSARIVYILYMYGMSRFAEKLNIQKYVNSMGNSVL